MTDNDRDALASLLVRHFCPEQDDPRYVAEFQRSGMRIPAPVEQSTMVSFVASDGHRSLRALTFGELADAVLSQRWGPHPPVTGEIDYVREVLDLYAEGEHDGMIWWRTDGEDGWVTFMAACSDVFLWGTADWERITPQNLPVLKQAFADARAVHEDGDTWATDLFCARLRGMRPQGAKYEHIPQELWPLFDACGPERAVGYGNPYRTPARPDTAG